MTGVLRDEASIHSFCFLGPFQEAVIVIRKVLSICNAPFDATFKGLFSKLQVIFEAAPMHSNIDLELRKKSFHLYN